MGDLTSIMGQACSLRDKCHVERPGHILNYTFYTRPLPISKQKKVYNGVWDRSLIRWVFLHGPTTKMPGLSMNLAYCTIPTNPVGRCHRGSARRFFGQCHWSSGDPPPARIGHSFFGVGMSGTSKIFYPESLNVLF